jgi:PAS domain S-box-containing protein
MTDSLEPTEPTDADRATAAAEPSDPPRWLNRDALAQLVHALADAVVIADTSGAIVLWNSAAAALFGWSAEEANGQSLDLIIPERLRARHWAGYRNVMRTGRTDYGNRVLEVPALHRDGRTVSIAFTVTLLFDPADSRVRAIAAVMRDDSERWQERRRLEAELATLTAERSP